MIKQWTSMAIVATLALSGYAFGQSTWNGAVDSDLFEAGNWDVAPAFDGTELLLINDFTNGRSLTLSNDISIQRMDIGDGANVQPVAEIGAGSTITLTNTVFDNATPMWLTRSRDGRSVDVNANITFDAGVGSGSYTAHFREQNNSSGGLNIYGDITQAAGESWEIRTNKNSARGALRLFGSNDVDTMRVNGMDITIGNVGAAGNAELIFNSGAFIFSGDRFNDPISNTLTMLSAATLTGQIRLTGEVNQSNQQLTLNGSSTNIMRFDPTTLTGTGQTVINTAALSVGTMGNISTGTLTIGGNNGNNADLGVFILGSGDVVSAAQFEADRTYNDGGGAGTWRLSTPSDARRGGGFAARNSDVVLASGFGGMDDSTLDRNFSLGSNATLDGSAYATNAVRIEQNINYTGTQRIVTVSGQAGQIINEGWQLNNTPVHELSGILTGPASGDFILAILTGSRTGTHGSTGGTGIVRISNENNDFSAADSSILIGGTRGTNSYLPSLRTASGDNGWDNGGGVAIFTSDAAFGGADEVVVRGGGSSGTNNGGVLLFENQDGGEKTFARDFFVVQNDGNGKAAFGSYAGDVRHTGTITQSGGGNDIMVHVESGQYRWDQTQFINDMTAGGSHQMRKNGDGTFVVEDSATFSGTFAGDYELFVQEGTVIWNKNTITFSNITVSDGASLGGSGTLAMSGNQSFNIDGELSPGNSAGLMTLVSGTGDLNMSASSSAVFEFFGTTLGTEYDSVSFTGDDLNLNSTPDLLLVFNEVFAAGTEFVLFDLVNGDSLINGTFNDLGSGFAAQNGITTTYSLDYAGGDGNDLTLTIITSIPEPSAFALLGLGALAILRRRRTIA